jgi:hypothetical protein
MQTDILLKQVLTSLTDLKTAIDKFEKHPSPSTHYADQLHAAINHSNKLVAAYVVLKEQKDVSPDLDLHLKIMSAEQPKSQPILDIKKEEPVKEDVKPEVVHVVEAPKEIVQAPAITFEKEKVAEPLQMPQPTVTATVPVQKDLPKLSVSINDKFRFINDLFSSNANEYSVAMEQLNNVGSKEEADTYLKGLKNIYHWDDEHEMVKKLYALNQKRFS